MTDKQKRFVVEYLVDFNGSAAARRAGYSANGSNANAARLLANHSIRAEIDKKLAEIQSRRTADAQEVLEYLTSVLRGESQSEIVVVESTGDFFSEARKIKKAPDERERLKAAELLARGHGIFVDKMKMEGPVAITFVEDLPDDD